MGVQSPDGRVVLLDVAGVRGLDLLGLSDMLLELGLREGEVGALHSIRIDEVTELLELGSLALQTQLVLLGQLDVGSLLLVRHGVPLVHDGLHVVGNPARGSRVLEVLHREEDAGHTSSLRLHRLEDGHRVEGSLLLGFLGRLRGLLLGRLAAGLLDGLRLDLLAQGLADLLLGG